MAPLSPPEKLLLVSSVGGMFAAAAFCAAEATSKHWKAPFARFAASSRTAQALQLAAVLALTALGGRKPEGTLERSVARMHPAAASGMPGWFIDSGLPAQDADESGIPDCWERWTHTVGMSAKADPDGDGLTNLEEFQARTDPIRPDTDGDGLDDGTEMAGLAAELPDFDPLAPASFATDEPDEDGDGVPDVWQDEDIPPFAGIDHDGFPAGFSMPEPGPDNYDVTVAVSTSRHVAFSWGDGEGETFLLPPCTNLALRLRLDAGSDRGLALDPMPGSGGAAGLWKAEISAEWSPERWQNVEGDRICTGNDCIVDMDLDGNRFAGVLPGTLPSASAGRRLAAAAPGSRPSVRCFFRRKSIELTGSPYCRDHGPALVVTAACNGVEPPLEWGVPGRGTVETDGLEFVPALYDWEGRHETVVTCTAKDGKKRLKPRAEGTFAGADCGQSRTNVVGACWYSSHDPQDPSDHEPRTETSVVRYLPDCPLTTNLLVVAGFTHDAGKLWTRNLVRVETGDPRDDETDHCTTVEWENNGFVVLWEYVAEATRPYTNAMEIVVDGRSGDGILRYGKEPSIRGPRVHHVELRLAGDSKALDRMWLVVVGTKDATEFGKWYDRYSTDLSWVDALPKPYGKLEIATDSGGRKRAVDPEPGSPYLWHEPKSTGGKLLHHDAAYEMRSGKTAGGHGNQACYDKDGNLIRSGISGGTADYAAPDGIFGLVSHAYRDVNPFMSALHLDGNPCSVSTFKSIDRPCLHQGVHLGKYLLCRPVVQP